MKAMQKIFAIFIIALAVTQSWAASLEPALKVDLHALGFESDGPLCMRWLGQYVVIDWPSLACDHPEPPPTPGSPPTVRLVIDSATGKRVPAETLAEVPPPDHPVEYRIDERRPQGAEGKLVAEWRGMALVVDKDLKLWLLEPGQPKVLVFYRLPYLQTATFVAPDRILIIGRVPDRPDCTLCHYHLWVVDKSGALKYKLPVELNPGRFDYYAGSQDGTRFVIRDDVEAGRELALDIATLGIAAPNLPAGTAVVKVHDSFAGKKLFEYRWRMSKDEEHDSSGRVALSDDGSLLALIRDETLLIFRLPSYRAP